MDKLLKQYRTFGSSALIMPDYCTQKMQQLPDKKAILPANVFDFFSNLGIPPLTLKSTLDI